MKKSIKFLIVFASIVLAISVWIVFAEDPIDVRIVPEKDWDEEPTGFNVSSNSMMIAAPRLRAVPNWVSGTGYQHGDMVRATNNTTRLYWCVNEVFTNIVAATCPTHHHGDADDGSLTWRRVPPHNRNGINIVNQGTNDVWLAVGDKNTTAVVNSGIHLRPDAAWFIDGTWMQFGVFAICNVESNRLTVQEW